LGPSFLTFSNPIIPPSVITEIYFGQWSWEIELCRNEFYNLQNLDSLWLYGQYDTAKFEYGIPFYGDIMVVTNYDMVTSMYIDQAGDRVYLYYKDGNYGEIIGWIDWGTFNPNPGQGVTAPEGEQSIAVQGFNLWEGEWEYWEVKELPHSIGSNPGQVNKRTHFEGYVKDKNNEPLSGIFIDYCDFYYVSTPHVAMIWTDSNGHFITDDMFCRKYHINFINGEYYGPSIGDTNINLEPDSTNYFEFQLDTLLTGINEIRHAHPYYSIYSKPNPSSSQTTFIIDTEYPLPKEKGVIKIYNENGFIVDIIPVDLNDRHTDLIYCFNTKSLLPGMYFCSLEIRNQKVASNKMIIQ
jgi:hypothetical protein